MATCAAASTQIKKKKRTQPQPDYPNAEVIALSPKTLMATNRFTCEVCKKGFQREQNLQLHKRGHNLPWELKPKNTTTNEVRKNKIYVCPEPTCVHHNPSRALGDLSGIKKHFSRKHVEKNWECERCSKKYAVLSDLKAHSKICGTKEYTCDCGTLFSRRDSFMTHRAFCNAIAQENGTNPTNLCDIITSQLLGSSRDNGDGFRSFSSLLPQLSGSDFTPASTHVNVLGCSHGRDQAHLAPNKLIYNGPVQKLSHDQIPSELLTDHSFFSNTARKDYHCESPIDDSHSNNSASTHLSSSNLFAKKFERSEVGGSSLSSGHQGLSSAGLFSNTESLKCDPISLSVYSSAASSLHNSNNASSASSAHLSATALLQKAAQVSSSCSINGSGSLLRALGSSFSSSKHPSPHNLLNASIWRV